MTKLIVSKTNWLESQRQFEFKFRFSVEHNTRFLITKFVSVSRFQGYGKKNMGFVK